MAGFVASVAAASPKQMTNAFAPASTFSATHVKYPPQRQSVSHWWIAAWHMSTRQTPQGLEASLAVTNEKSASIAQPPSSTPVDVSGVDDVLESGAPPPPDDELLQPVAMLAAITAMPASQFKKRILYLPLP